MTEPLMEDEEGLTIAWGALSGDEVLRALQTAPHVAGAWAEGDPKWEPGLWRRYDLSTGSIARYDDGERREIAWTREHKTATEVEKRFVDMEEGTVRCTVEIHIKSVFLWEADHVKGECTTLALAKASCDSVLETRGWVFATTEGKDL